MTSPQLRPIGVRPKNNVQKTLRYTTSVEGGCLNLFKSVIDCVNEQQDMMQMPVPIQCPGLCVGGEATFNLQDPDDRRALGILITQLQSALGEECEAPNDDGEK